MTYALIVPAARPHTPAARPTPDPQPPNPTLPTTSARRDGALARNPTRQVSRDAGTPLGPCRRGRIKRGRTSGPGGIRRCGLATPARGIRDRSIYFHHALKNTLIPVITVAGLQLGALIAFSIITETVFQWPGLGLLIIQAITFADIPVIAAYLILIALLFVTINAVVDMLYFWVDPRVRLG